MTSTGGMAPSEGARRWFVGLVGGLVLPYFVLSTLMPLGAVLVVLVVVWINSSRERLAPAGGALIGFGAVTLALFLSANASCGTPGTCYESSPALRAAAALVVVGVVLTGIRLFRD